MTRRSPVSRRGGSSSGSGSGGVSNGSGAGGSGTSGSVSGAAAAGTNGSEVAAGGGGFGAVPAANEAIPVGVAVGRVNGGGRSGGIALPSCEKLQGRENYSPTFAMKMMLIRDKSWYTVKPAEGQPIDEEDCLRTLSTICLSLEKTNYSLVQEAETAREAWENMVSIQICK